MTHSHKAALVTGVLALVGIGTLLFRAPISSLTWAHVLFFVVLLINTFYSVRFYSAIQPDDAQNVFIDAALFLAYLALALEIGRAGEFASAALVLFILAPVKYTFMLGKLPYLALLRAKILIDITGALACAILLIATVLGYATAAAWTFALVFALANVYLLLVEPMYRFEWGS